ncbi:unnamed protein product [Amoebophrya sp. A25]|nr:unnamed protein product [Amoebophrya sp. A25]|eukprot:GSA25T00020564001.1
MERNKKMSFTSRNMHSSSQRGRRGRFQKVLRSFVGMSALVLGVSASSAIFGRTLTFPQSNRVVASVPVPGHRDTSNRADAEPCAPVPGHRATSNRENAEQCASKTPAVRGVAPATRQATTGNPASSRDAAPPGKAAPSSGKAGAYTCSIPPPSKGTAISSRNTAPSRGSASSSSGLVRPSNNQVASGTSSGTLSTLQLLLEMCTDVDGGLAIYDREQAMGVAKKLLARVPELQPNRVPVIRKAYQMILHHWYDIRRGKLGASTADAGRAARHFLEKNILALQKIANELPDFLVNELREFYLDPSTHNLGPANAEQRAVEEVMYVVSKILKEEKAPHLVHLLERRPLELYHVEDHSFLQMTPFHLDGAKVRYQIFKKLKESFYQDPARMALSDSEARRRASKLLLAHPHMRMSEVDDRIRAFDTWKTEYFGHPDYVALEEREARQETQNFYKRVELKQIVEVNRYSRKQEQALQLCTTPTTPPEQNGRASSGGSSSSSSDGASSPGGSFPLPGVSSPVVPCVLNESPGRDCRVGPEDEAWITPSRDFDNPELEKKLTFNTGDLLREYQNSFSQKSTLSRHLTRRAIMSEVAEFWEWHHIAPQENQPREVFENVSELPLPDRSRSRSRSPRRRESLLQRDSVGNGAEPGTTTSRAAASGSDDLCVVCFDKKKSHLFLPCGHFGWCKGCAERVLCDEDTSYESKCYVCKAHVEDIALVRPV